MNKPVDFVLRPSSTSKRVPAALAFLITIVLSASCSSSSSPPATPPARAAVACGLGSPQAAVGEPIVVGAVLTETGGADFSSAGGGARAYFDCINANGGIHGRPIKFLSEDDALNPQQASSAAARLVDVNKAVALVGSSSEVDCAVNSKFYQQRDILALYGTATSEECFNAANIAPVNTGPLLGAIASAQYAQSKGAKSVVLVAPQVPGVGEWIRTGLQSWATTHGMQINRSILVPPGIKNGTSLVLQAKDAKADAIIFVLPGADNITFLQAAEKQKLRTNARYVCLSPCYDRRFPKAVGKYWDGLDINSEFQLLDADTPDNSLWRAVMAKYAPRATADSFSQGGLLAAKIFTDTMLKIPDANSIDRRTATAALRSVTNYTSDLICSPFFIGPAPRHNANNASRMVRMTGTNFTQSSACTAIGTAAPAAGGPQPAAAPPATSTG